MLKNSPKISYITNTDIFQLNFCQSDKQNDKSAVIQISQVFGNLLTCWLLKDVLILRFLKIVLAKSSTVCNFGNT